MRQILVVLVVLILLTTQSFAQAYLDEIVSKSCKCVEAVPESVTDKNEFQMKIGLCMIEAALPYKKQLKKNHDVDLENLNTETGQKLGALIGVKLVGSCPSVAMRMANTVKAAPVEEKANEELTVSGVITKIESDFFVTYSLKDESGKIQKFYWLSFIESNDDLASNYKSLVGKTVSISYEAMEFFDPKIGEYRPYFVITNIEQ